MTRPLESGEALGRLAQVLEGRSRAPPLGGEIVGDGLDGGLGVAARVLGANEVVDELFFVELS